MNYAFLFGISKAGQVLDMVDQDTVKGRAPQWFPSPGQKAARKWALWPAKMEMKER
jgi:hypothetical protein